MNDLDETELQSPFPSPPSHYANYTTHNLNLLSLLRERCSDIDSEPDSVDQHQLLSDQPDIPDFPLTLLEKPRVDWIMADADAYYDVFGDRWFAKEKIPSLEDLGGTQLYPKDSNTDRRPVLNSILRSVLVTYSYLTKSLLEPPPSALTATPPEWQRHIEWLMILSQNLMAAANDLRPVQALENLENMMKQQLQIRRDETSAIHKKCDELEDVLAQLRASAKVATKPFETTAETTKTTTESLPTVGPDEVLSWVEEAG